MGSNTMEEDRLRDTLGAFRDNNLETISSAQGIMLIDGWLQALDGDPNLDGLKALLTELRTALQATQPDEASVRNLLVTLADQAQAVAEDKNSEGTWTGGLESLSKILRHLGSNS